MSANRHLLPLIAAAWAALVAAREAPAPPSAEPNLRVLVLDGSPYNRGLIHGRAMKDRIHAIVNLWKDHQ